MSRRQARPLVNPVALAMQQAALLPAVDVQRVLDILRTAVSDLKRGIDPEWSWAQVVDCLAVAEVLAEMGLGSGDDVRVTLERIQCALADLHTRAGHRGTWAMYADEIDAIDWLPPLHAVQLGACSYGEYSRAIERVRNRSAGALAGNAGRGMRVITAGSWGAADPEAASRGVQP